MSLRKELDKFDLEAANEGKAIKNLNELRPKNDKNKAKQTIKHPCMITA